MKLIGGVGDLFVIGEDMSIFPYLGNDTIQGSVPIFKQKIMSSESEDEALLDLDFYESPITFSNGNAVKSWNERKIYFYE